MAGFKKGKKLENLEKHADDWTPVLRAIGTMLVGRAMQAFTEQKRGAKRWPARAVPNRAGILSDLKAGRTPPDRRYTDRPAGIDTGRLRGSLAYKVTARDTVTFGTNVPYARKVQEGGTSVMQVGGSRKALAALLRKRPDLRAKLGFLFHTGELTISVPPRPFATVEPKDRKDIDKLVKDHLRGRT